MATKEDLVTIKDDIKNDMTTMEDRILQTFQQVITTIRTQHPQSE
jgi:hypothetical protein